jgi:hypothetical protein
VSYHDQPGLSFSQLKVFAESPRLYEAEYITKTVKRKPTAAMDTGTATHMVLFEPHVAMTEIIRIPSNVLSKSGARSGKAWDDFEQEHSGKILLKHQEYVNINNTCEAVRNHPIAGKLIAADGECEVPVSWEYNAVPMRSKLDKICKSGIVVDLKTAQDCSEKPFAKTVADQLYHLQGYMYVHAALHQPNTLFEDWQFVWIAVEPEPPYRVRCYRLGEEAWRVANTMFVRLIDQFKECQSTGIWADRDEDRLIDLMLPQYAIWKEVSEV